MSVISKFRDKWTIAGFAIPIFLALLVASFLHFVNQPGSVDSKKLATKSSTISSGTGPLPSSEEINAANNVILEYCSRDLRKDTSCTLNEGTNQTAPGFVEIGLRINGSFAADGSSSQGLALAKGSGQEWSVIWVGQNCIPHSIAATYNVPMSLHTCP